MKGFLALIFIILVFVLLVTIVSAAQFMTGCNTHSRSIILSSKERTENGQVICHYEFQHETGLT